MGGTEMLLVEVETVEGNVVIQDSTKQREHFWDNWVGTYCKNSFTYEPAAE